MSKPGPGSQQAYAGILHASVIVSDLARALVFYRDVLGLPVDPARPNLSFPGAWLWIGAQQIHLMQIEGASPTPPVTAISGRDRHTAIGIVDLSGLKRRLADAGVEYVESTRGRRLFCRDPDGNTLEFAEVAGDGN